MCANAFNVQLLSLWLQEFVLNLEKKSFAQYIYIFACDLPGFLDSFQIPCFANPGDIQSLP